MKFLFFASPDALSAIHFMCRLSIPYFLEPDLVHYLLNVGLLLPLIKCMNQWSFPFLKVFFFCFFFDSKENL